jgi:hypothetical protein
VRPCPPCLPPLLCVPVDLNHNTSFLALRYVLKSDNRLVRLKEPITSSSGTGARQPAAATGTGAGRASPAPPALYSSIPPPPPDDDDDDDFGFALPPKPPQQQQAPPQQAPPPRAAASPVNELYQQRWEYQPASRDPAARAVEAQGRGQGSDRDRGGARTPQRQQQQIVFEYEPERPSSRSSVRGESDGPRLQQQQQQRKQQQQQQLDMDELPIPRPPSRAGSVGPVSAAAAKAPFVRAVALSSKPPRSMGDEYGRSVSPDVMAPPPIPRYPPPTVPSGKSAVPAASKQRVVLDAGDGDAVDFEGAVAGRGGVSAPDARAADVIHAAHDRRSRQQQPGFTRPLSQERSPPVQDKRASADLAPRNSVGSSGSSRPSSSERPPPLPLAAPYLLPPRPYTITVCDTDTQTPQSWAEGSASELHLGPAAAALAPAPPAAAADVLKYTGRAVPGAVINEQHNLFTLVQVRAVCLVRAAGRGWLLLTLTRRR